LFTNGYKDISEEGTLCAYLAKIVAGRTLGKIHCPSVRYFCKNCKSPSPLQQDYTRYVLGAEMKYHYYDERLAHIQNDDESYLFSFGTYMAQISFLKYYRQTDTCNPDAHGN
jgi:hypothetical protein